MNYIAEISVCLERFLAATPFDFVTLRSGGSPLEMTVLKSTVMTDDEPSSIFDAYLLRAWRESAHGNWRFWVKDIRTGQERGFRDLDMFVEFLDTRYGQ